MVPAGPGCENEVRNKKVKRHMVSLLFYCISFRCRLVEDFSCGLFFCVSFSCRLLEASGSQDHFAKQNEKASGISRTSLSNNFCPMLAKRRMSRLIVTADQGGFEPLTTGHRH